MEDLEKKVEKADDDALTLGFLAGAWFFGSGLMLIGVAAYEAGDEIVGLAMLAVWVLVAFGLLIGWIHLRGQHTGLKELLEEDEDE